MKNTSDMAKAIDKFLSELCIELGFCLPPNAINSFKKSEHLEASDFARAILEAEGMDADLEIEWKRKIENKFTECFGNEIYANEFKNDF